MLVDTETAPKKETRGTLQILRLLFFPGLALDDSPLRRGEFWDLVKVFFGAVTFVSLAMAVQSFTWQRKALEQEYKWRHMKEAQDILHEWDQRTGAQKAEVESFFRRRYGWKNMQSIPVTDAEQMRAAVAGEPEGSEKAAFWKVRCDTIALLNYFETISTSALRGIADEDILNDSLGTPMISWREYMRSFTDLLDADQHRPVWQPYYQMVDRWKTQSAPKVAIVEMRKPSHGWKSLEGR